MQVKTIKLSEIEDFNLVPDKEILDSVRRQGVLVPIRVTQSRAGRKYRVTDGLRRVASLRIATVERWEADLEAQAERAGGL